MFLTCQGAYMITSSFLPKSNLQKEHQLDSLLRNYAQNENISVEELLSCLKSPDILLSVFNSTPGLFFKVAIKSAKGDIRIFNAILIGLKIHAKEFTQLIKLLHPLRNIYRHIMDAVPFSEMPTDQLTIEMKIEMFYECLGRVLLKGRMEQLADFLKTPNFLTVFNNTEPDRRIVNSSKMLEIFSMVLDLDPQKYKLLLKEVLKLLVRVPGLPEKYLETFRDSNFDLNYIFCKALRIALMSDDTFLLFLLKNINSDDLSLDHFISGGRSFTLKDLLAISFHTPQISVVVKQGLENVWIAKGLEKAELMQSANELHSAVYLGDTNKIKAVIRESHHNKEAEAKLHQRLPCSYNPLQLAIYRGYEKIAILLVEAGITPEAGGPDQQSAFIMAIQYGQLAVLQKLAENGLSNTDIQEAFRHAVVTTIDPQVVAFLLEAGADINDPFISTPKGLFVTPLENILDEISIDMPLLKALLVHRPKFNPPDEFDRAELVRDVRKQINFDFKRVMVLTFALRLNGFPPELIATIVGKAWDIPYKTQTRLCEDIAKLCQKMDPMLTQVRIEKQFDYLNELDLMDLEVAKSKESGDVLLDQPGIFAPYYQSQNMDVADAAVTLETEQRSTNSKRKTPPRNKF
jgi:hypothetical protein